MVAAPDVNIFVDVVDRMVQELDVDAARSVLRIRFADRQIRRMNKLSKLAREGKLSDAERNELESFLRIGNFLTILHSKARQALRRAGAPAGRV